MQPEIIDMGAPIALNAFQFGAPILWLLMAVVFLKNAETAGELSRAALLFLGGTTMWWQEWYADWGGYLIFSYEFAQIPWGLTPYTAPSKPWAVIPSYGWYFGLAFGFMAWLVDRAMAKKKWGPFLASVIVVGPLFYVWDLIVEGGATALNWWEYTNNFGPELKTPNGNFPIVYPIIPFVATAIIMVWAFVKRDAQGFFMHERWAGVPGMARGFKREAVRVLASAVWLNLMFGLLLVLPLVLVRIVFGGPSTIIP